MRLRIVELGKERGLFERVWVFCCCGGGLLHVLHDGIRERSWYAVHALGGQSVSGADCDRRFHGVEQHYGICSTSIASMVLLSMTSRFSASVPQ